MVAVIKNGMTEQEMKESGERWATHEGPYMTLQEVLDIEAAKQHKWSWLTGPTAHHQIETAERLATSQGFVSAEWQSGCLSWNCRNRLRWQTWQGLNLPDG